MIRWSPQPDRLEGGPSSYRDTWSRRRWRLLGLLHAERDPRVDDTAQHTEDRSEGRVSISTLVTSIVAETHS